MENATYFCTISCIFNRCVTVLLCVIFQIQDEVEAEYGPNVVSLNVIVGMFLVSQGADTYTKNLKGVSPLQVQPADISELVSQCRSRR